MRDAYDNTRSVKKMKAEIKKRYSICIEIDQGTMGSLIGDIEFFENVSRDVGLGNHYTIFEFQKMLIAKLEEIAKTEAGL